MTLRGRNGPAGGRPKKQIKDSVKAVFDCHGVKVLEDVLTDEDAKDADRIRAAEVSAKIGGISTGNCPHSPRYADAIREEEGDHTYDRNTIIRIAF
ncbi:MAG: hypothetical protein O7D97_08470 [Planctomycetota bacterium]|nr:hypothetical protein [Planctomycetota bacterium]